MAKPDWGALQHQFLAEHAKSGISPKDWCEAQGLNYASAKRYIKIANSAANSQKKLRIKLRIRRKEKCVTPLRRRLAREKIKLRIKAKIPQILQKRNRYADPGGHRQQTHSNPETSKPLNMGDMGAACFYLTPLQRMHKRSRWMMSFSGYVLRT